MNLQDYARPDWLAYVSSIGVPEAHIAGGALRDSILGRPIKDVDIFVRVGSYEAAVAAAGALSEAVHLNISSKYAQGNLHSAVAWTLNFEHDDTDYNVIGLFGGPDDPDEWADWNVSRFDLGICRVWGRPKDTLRVHADFAVDARLSEMTVRNAANAEVLAATMRRHKRLTEKYVGWPLVIPNEFAHLTKDAQDELDIFG